MITYAQVGTNNRVHSITPTENRLIEVADDRVLGSWYIDGSFLGHKIVLTTDKSTIAADGVDTATITATVYNWDDSVATDFAHDITFSDGAVSLTVTPTNGVGQFAYDSAEPGVHTITAETDDPYMMSKTEVQIDAE